jgi:xyloglucan:xyloglucosyl transferase
MARRWPPILLAGVVLAALLQAGEGTWLDDTFKTRGDVRADYDDSGHLITTLVLDRHSGSSLISKDKYLFGRFSIEAKLVGGNSAGTVSCFYVSLLLVSLRCLIQFNRILNDSAGRSEPQLTSGPGNGTDHDEIDMEFMGNTTGDPVVLNTNVWASGDGKKEHQFNLWFDPAADFHRYTIIWNRKNIIFQVDDVTVRAFRRYADLPYPDARPMEVHATFWDGSFWATRNGAVKIDWDRAPFFTSYRGYTEHACVADGGKCAPASDQWMDRVPDHDDDVTVAWAKKNCMSYNYCADGWRFPKGFPAECRRDASSPAS